MAWVQLAYDLPFVHNQDSVGHLQHLVKLEGDQQDRFARIALGKQLLAHKFDGAHIQAARGLHGNEQIIAQINLAGDDRLLLVAAGTCCAPP